MSGSLSNVVRARNAMRTLAVVSVGSNLDRRNNIRSAITQLRQQYGAVALSPVYETAAVGFVGAPFYNLVIGLHAPPPWTALRATLQRVEQLCGRDPQAKSFDDRTLDLDLILFGATNQPQDNIPSRDLGTCAYILKPLAALYPQARHPVSGQSFSTLWQQFTASTDPTHTTQWLRPVEFVMND